MPDKHLLLKQIAQVGPVTPENGPILTQLMRYWVHDNKPGFKWGFDWKEGPKIDIHSLLDELHSYINFFPEFLQKTIFLMLRDFTQKEKEESTIRSLSLFLKKASSVFSDFISEPYHQTSSSFEGKCISNYLGSKYSKPEQLGLFVRILPPSMSLEANPDDRVREVSSRMELFVKFIQWDDGKQRLLSTMTDEVAIARLSTETLIMRAKLVLAILTKAQQILGLNFLRSFIMHQSIGVSGDIPQSDPPSEWKLVVNPDEKPPFDSAEVVRELEQKGRYCDSRLGLFSQLLTHKDTVESIELGYKLPLESIRNLGTVCKTMAQPVKMRAGPI